jgi:hypothetical protein
LFSIYDPTHIHTLLFLLSLNKDKITKHVDHFVDSKLQITADDLVNLEKTISDDTTTPPPPQPAPQVPLSPDPALSPFPHRNHRTPRVSTCP